MAINDEAWWRCMKKTIGIMTFRYFLAVWSSPLVLLGSKINPRPQYLKIMMCTEFDDRR